MVHTTFYVALVFATIMEQVFNKTCALLDVNPFKYSITLKASKLCGTWQRTFQAAVEHWHLLRVFRKTSNVYTPDWAKLTPETFWALMTINCNCDTDVNLCEKKYLCLYSYMTSEIFVFVFLIRNKSICMFNHKWKVFDLTFEVSVFDPSLYNAGPKVSSAEYTRGGEGHVWLC